MILLRNVQNPPHEILPNQNFHTQLLTQRQIYIIGKDSRIPVARYRTRSSMNPYEANPTKIPDTDRYSDVPFYGRYLPQPNDFKPDPDHVNSTSVESLEYWVSILGRCDESVRIYENQDGGRDVFALGGVIVKSSHLKDRLEGRRAHRDYSFADANEVQATALVRKVMTDVKAPDIYFASKVLPIPKPRVQSLNSLSRY